MSDFALSFDWVDAGGGFPEVRDTTGQLKIFVGGACLTRNEEIWSKVIRDSVLVSGYPLAIWLAASWWRLKFESLPNVGDVPSPDWRMSHELGAVSHGYVWPGVAFAMDGDSMGIWTTVAPQQCQGSVKYLVGLERRVKVDAAIFFREAARFIESVLARLDALGHQDTHLSRLWHCIQEEQRDPESLQYRRREAELGYDPDECPEAIMKAEGLQGNPWSPQPS